jgi:hypothetical protein
MTVNLKIELFNVGWMVEYKGVNNFFLIFFSKFSGQCRFCQKDFLLDVVGYLFCTIHLPVSSVHFQIFRERNYNIFGIYEACEVFYKENLILCSIFSKGP